MATIIKLDDGYSRVYKNGIVPFFKFLEDQEDKNFFTAKEFITYYDLVYQMANQPAPNDYSAQLYEKFSGIIAEYCANTVKPSLEAARQRFDMAFLNEWRVRWKKFRQATLGVRHVFQYLDRFYTKEKEGTLDLIPQAYKIFKEQVFDKYAPIARQFIIATVERERNGEPADQSLLKDSVTVFVEMGYNWKSQKLNLYRDELEKQIVVDAGAYYKRNSPTWVEQDSTPIYLERAEKMLASERKRVDAYLNAVSLEPLTSECYTHILKAHQRELIEKKTGMRAILDNNSKTDLSRFYNLYKRQADDLVPLANAVERYISDAGKALVDQAKVEKKEEKKKDADGKEVKGETPDGKAEEGGSSALSGLQLVQSLIALHARFAHIVDSCFQKALVFQKALKAAFTDFINADTRVCQLLAQFVHDLLQKGNKFKVEDLEDTLDQVVFIYSYIREKDIFEHEYQKYLSTRLLEGSSRSEHTEKALIGKLKVEAGYAWVNKLEGMFKDVQSSNELNTVFKNAFPSPALELRITVCSKANWPPTPQLHGKVPRELTASCDAFRKFYKEKQSMHKIEWMWDLGQAEINVLFRPGYPRTLCLSTLQMMVMLVFNSPSKTTGVMTTQEIMDVTGLPMEVIADGLVSLAVPSVGVLDKMPKSKDLEADHKFRLNPKYTNQLRKVVVPYMRGLVPMKRKVQTGPNKVDLARQHMIDAALVRVMKVRQTMKHGQLMAEVISQLKARFDPKPTLIRKRIDHLIDCPEPYMRRDEGDRSVLHYVP